MGKHGAGTVDAEVRATMSLATCHPVLRALLWVVIAVVPGGMLLMALLAADSWQRRQRAAFVPGVPSLPQPGAASGSETA